MLPEISVPAGSTERDHNEADDETWKFTTPLLRQIRVSEELWDKASAKALNEGYSGVSEVVRLLLQEYTYHADDSVSIAEELNRIMDRINMIRKRLMIGEVSRQG
ncbi:MAG: hypothetical protein NVS4B6_19430 [Mycobacterium sp.]